MSIRKAKEINEWRMFGNYSVWNEYEASRYAREITITDRQAKNAFYAYCKLDERNWDYKR